MALVNRLIHQVTGMVAGGPQAWRDLGHARRQDVLHHVRQGRPDPDPAVWAIAVAWARWWLATPLWRRLLRVTGIALGVYVAMWLAIFALVPLLLLIPDSSFEVRDSWWIVRGGVHIAVFVFVCGVVPWVDARKVERLSGTPSDPGRGPARGRRW